MTNKQKAKTLVVPLLIIAIGVGWLLNAIGVIADINWIWTIGLAAVGLLTLFGDGLNKVSVVIGPFFVVASFLSLLRQTGRMSPNVEVPWLVIAFGSFLLISHLSRLPAPDWILDDKER